MDTTALIFIVAGALLLLIILILIAIVALYFQMRHLRGSGETSRIVPELAVVGEKLSHLEPVVQNMSGLQSEIRAISERMSAVESNQGQVQQGIAYLANNAIASITELKTLTGGLNQATGAMRDELARAKNDLSELHAHVRAGLDWERQTAESMRRLETIIAGTQSKGAAGENLLELVFSKLPVEWQVRDFRVGGKCVEFALRLPNNLVMPIDSKWTATNLLKQFNNTEDLLEQQRVKRAIEIAVLQKANEVRKYLDPSLTVNFGLAAIPDAVYDLCSGIMPEAFQMNVVLVSYSMFVPYLLLVFQTTLKNSQSLDLRKLEAYLQTARESISTLQDELDGRFTRSLTMMNNSRDEMRVIVGRLADACCCEPIRAQSREALGNLEACAWNQMIYFRATRRPRDCSRWSVRLWMPLGQWSCGSRRAR